MKKMSLNKHLKETVTKQAEKKAQSANTSEVTQSLRSQGDGESFDFVSDESIQKRLKETGDEKKEQLWEETPAVVSAATGLSSGDMEKYVGGARSKINEKPALSVEAKAESNQGDGNWCGFKSNRTQKGHQIIRYGSERNRSVTYASSAVSESEESVVNTSKKDKSYTDETSSFTSSSFTEEDDEEDDSENDDDDDYDSDDDDESEEEEMEGETSDEVVTHYSSSLNASISSIPTPNEDSALSRESPEAELEQNNDNKFDTSVFQEEEMKGGSEEAKKDERGIKIEEELHSNHSPPSSRQVSGRSATPRTVLLGEFDGVESGIFDRKELSQLESNSRNKITSSEASGNCDVTIKNWPGFIPECVTSHAQSITPIEKPRDTLKRKETKKLKKKKTRNAIMKKIESKGKACDEEQNTSCSSNSDITDKIQTKAIRRKRKPKTQVSFEQFNPESVTKVKNSDAAFERCKLRRGAQSPSSHAADSQCSDQAGDQSEESSSLPGSPRPVSITPASRSFSSSRQTLMVDNPAVSHEKERRLPSKKRRNGR